MTALPADFARPKRHEFVEQRGTDECGWCSLSQTEGLHADPEPAFVDVESTPGGEYQPGDVLRSGTGSLFTVEAGRYPGVVFVPLGAVGPGQGTVPKGAVLLARGEQR